MAADLGTQQHVAVLPIQSVVLHVFVVHRQKALVVPGVHGVLVLLVIQELELELALLETHALQLKLKIAGIVLQALI